MSIVEQQQVVVPEGSYQADPVHSSLSFEVQYMGVSIFAASVKSFEAELVDGRLTGSAQIASLETKDENLHTHLMAPDFFDAERYPSVSFSSDQVAQSGDELVFEGEITIKGVSQPATLRGTLTGPVNDPYGRTRYGLRLETSIDRTAFGIEWNADMPDGSKALANEVTLKADLSLVKAA
jgi:polyisoprenoid-binding protein YceI